MNYKLKISYDGTDYHGFQIQKNVEKTVESVLKSKIDELFNVNVKLISAGRTDKGVHALGQIINFNIDLDINPNRMKNAINKVLPDDIRVEEVEIVDDDFHSRYSAKNKTYIYKIYTGEKNIFLDRYYYHYNKHDNSDKEYKYLSDEIDLNNFQKYLDVLKGSHNFKYFCLHSNYKHIKNKNFNRNVFDAKIFKVNNIENNNDIYHIEIKADGFLYKMVRVIIKSVFDSIENDISVDEFKSIFESDKFQKYRVMPANGLYLKELRY